MGPQIRWFHINPAPIPSLIPLQCALIFVFLISVSSFLVVGEEERRGEVVSLMSYPSVSTDPACPTFSDLVTKGGLLFNLYSSFCYLLDNRCFHFLLLLPTSERDLIASITLYQSTARTFHRSYKSVERLEKLNPSRKCHSPCLGSPIFQYP